MPPAVKPHIKVHILVGFVFDHPQIFQCRQINPWIAESVGLYPEMIGIVFTPVGDSIVLGSVGSWGLPDIALTDITRKLMVISTAINRVIILIFFIRPSFIMVLIVQTLF